MTTLKRQLRIQLTIFTFAILLGACADRRPLNLPPVSQFSANTPETAIAVADVFFGENVLQAFQLQVSGRSLYLTGKPFAFSRWDVAADPEAPNLSFAASDNMNSFSNIETNGPWLVDAYASGALAIVGSTAIMSGNVGTSVVDISISTQPREIQRHPRFNGEQFVRDEAFVYRGLVALPGGGRLLGFREQDFVYTLGADTSALRLLAKDAYSSEPICCVEGAAMFRNRAFVAARSELWVFDTSGGRLGRPLTIKALQAVNVASTANHVFVQHEPSLSSVVAEYPRGIYMFDTSGSFVAHFPISPIKFAVYNDTHIYANMDDQSIRIYRILWENIGGGIASGGASAGGGGTGSGNPPARTQ